MSQDFIDWDEINHEYSELWDWILRECDGDWEKEYHGRSSKKAEVYRTKLGRFAEIRKLVDSHPRDYYFCWMKTNRDTWCRGMRRCRNHKDLTAFSKLASKDQNFMRIDFILYQLQSDSDRYYWLSALYSALQDCIKNGGTREKLTEARKDYRSCHTSNSEIFDYLLKYQGDVQDAVNVLYRYIVDLRYLDVDESVEVAESFSAIRVDQIDEEQAGAIKRAAEEEFRKYLESETAKICRYYSFIFCKDDIVYPHRRKRLVPFFKKFVNVAAIDFFYMCISEDFRHSDFSDWPNETTHTIDRWSKEHVDSFEDFFIGYAEQNNKTWRIRFDSGINSTRPTIAERYLKSVFKISERIRDRPSRKQISNSDVGSEVSPIDERLMQRKKAAYDAYVSKETLKEAGERIGKQFNNGTPLSAKRPSLSDWWYSEVSATGGTVC